MKEPMSRGLTNRRAYFRPMNADVRITPDAGNPNCLRIYEGGTQLCKVYGWSPEDARAKADRIASALLPVPSLGDEVEIATAALKSVCSEATYHLTKYRPHTLRKVEEALALLAQARAASPVEPK